MEPVVVLILLVFAFVLFLLAIKNYGAPAWNLIAAGLASATLAAIIEFVKGANFQ